MKLSESIPKKISNAFWLWAIIVIAVIVIFSFVFLILIIKSGQLEIGNWFDLFVGFAGLALAILVTWYAKVQNWVNEKYCVALLAFLAFVMYGLITYDVKTQQCKSCFKNCINHKDSENHVEESHGIHHGEKQPID